MERKRFLRSEKSDFVYSDLYTQPDQSLTIGDMIERHIDPSSVSNHQSEAFEDTNLDNPVRYDMDLTDVPTKYQDGDYFDTLESARKSFIDAASGSRTPQSNTNQNTDQNEKGSPSNSQSLPLDS